jgi:hypothetical protein
LGSPLVELFGTDVDWLREKNLFRKLESVDTTPRTSILIVILLRLSRGAGRGLSIVWRLDKKKPQGFLHHGLLIRELAVLDLLSKKSVQIVGERDIHDRESCPANPGSGWPLRDPVS